MLALALDRRSAAEELGIGPGDQVLLTPFGDDEGDAGRGATSPVSIRRTR
jgi:hypothetical protein